MEERIMTLHPEGKKGVNILQRRYALIKNTIIEILKEFREIEFNKMNEIVIQQLKDRFDGKITWYVVTVKLDLEARGIIEKVKGSNPQRLKLKREELY